MRAFEDEDIVNSNPDNVSSKPYKTVKSADVARSKNWSGMRFGFAEITYIGKVSSNLFSKSDYFFAIFIMGVSFLYLYFLFVLEFEFISSLSPSVRIELTIGMWDKHKKKLNCIEIQIKMNLSMLFIKK